MTDIADRFAQSVGSDAGGGYIVPPGFLAKLTERKLAYGGFAPNAMQLNTSNGIPLTRSGDEARLYGKQISEGSAELRLSPEEEEALRLALPSKSK